MSRKLLASEPAAMVKVPAVERVSDCTARAPSSDSEAPPTTVTLAEPPEGGTTPVCQLPASFHDRLAPAPLNVNGAAAAPRAQQSTANPQQRVRRTGAA